MAKVQMGCCDTRIRKLLPVLVMRRGVAKMVHGH